MPLHGCVHSSCAEALVCKTNALAIELQNRAKELVRKQCTDVPSARINGNSSQHANYKCFIRPAVDTCQRHVRTNGFCTLSK